MNLKKIINFFSFEKETLIIIAVILFFKTFVYTHNIIPSGSMMPITMPADIVTVNKLAYHVKVPFTDKIIYSLNTPEIGDVVTFDEPNLGKYMIKRVIAKEGDVVVYKNREIFINGEKINKKPLNVKDEVLSNMLKNTKSKDYDFFIETNNNKEYIVAYAKLDKNSSKEILEYLDRSFKYTVPAGQYFVMGDNRNESVDSRYFGAVNIGTITGKAHMVLFNYKRHNVESLYDLK